MLTFGYDNELSEVTFDSFVYDMSRLGWSEKGIEILYDYMLEKENLSGEYTIYDMHETDALYKEIYISEAMEEDGFDDFDDLLDKIQDWTIVVGYDFKADTLIYEAY